MVQLEQCKMGYKLCHNLLPSNLTQNMLLDHRSHSIVKEHRYPTRSKSTPNLPGAMNAKYRSSFLYSTIREYSALDNSLKQAKNLHVFVKKTVRYGYWSPKHKYNLYSLTLSGIPNH